MIDRVRAGLLRLLRVPAEPDPPAGDPDTIRVFRAAPNYFRYRLVGWALGQLGTLAGLVGGLVLLGLLDDRFGGWVGVALTVAELMAWAAFLAQIPVSLMALRLGYELRWYMLSDRALRIREGILSTRERTMTFANIQRIGIRQGPLQRALGIADIEVRTAGGGASDGEAGDDMHRGYFRGVADPEVIRDTIRERVRRYRDSGLGALGDAGLPAPAPTSGRSGGERDPGQAVGAGAVAAAREVLAEVRALRGSLPVGR